MSSIDPEERHPEHAGTGDAPEGEPRAGGWRVPPRYGNVRLNESGVVPYGAQRPLAGAASGHREAGELRALTRRALDDTAAVVDGMRREQADIERMRAETRSILARLRAA